MRASDSPMESNDRIARNEALFREVNERVEAGLWPVSDDKPVAFRCECGSLHCNQLVELTVAAYERVRASGARFVLVRGHEIPQIESVLEREAGYVVVEKLGEAAEVCQNTDPRDD